MTPLSKLLTFFPTFLLLLILSCLSWLIIKPSIFSFLVLLFCLYGFPLLIYRIHQYFYPIQEGISYLKGEEYNPWWGSQQIQLIYNAFPFLETIIHFVPGLFSFWLRLWGAKVGNNIYWIPNVRILDRGLIEIGDNVILAYNTRISSHIIKPKKNDLLLYVKTVKIGNNVFVSGDVVIAPGVVIEDGAFIPYGKLLDTKVKCEDLANRIATFDENEEIKLN